jgi:DNA-binding response OmpR family regulator
MALETLVVTANPNALQLVRRTMESLGADVIAIATAEEGALILARRKFDAVVVDCDDDALPGVSSLPRKIRLGTSNRSSIVFALTDGTSTSRLALADGANFVLEKPLQPDRVARIFRSALGLMRRENRRYFRLAIELPVTLETEDGKTLHGATLNLSKKGLALREGVQAAGARARIKFTLPQGHLVECAAVVTWTTPAGSGPAGLQILTMAECDREILAEFIDRAAADAELSSPPGDRHRPVMIVNRSHWWHKLRKGVLRSIGRWPK